MSATRPLLVIISGPPAAGKTTLAEPLAQQLGLRLISKDAIKEHLADTEPGTADLDARAERLLHASAEHALDRGEGIVLEAFFQANDAEAHLESLIDRTNAICLHVIADPTTLFHRYAVRAAAGTRHLVHGDHLWTDIPEVAINRRATDGTLIPLRLTCPVIIIDTTTTWPDIDDLAQRIRTLGNIRR